MASERSSETQTGTVTTPERALSYGLRVQIINGPSRGIRRSIGQAGVRIGSADDNDITLDDRRVSRNHLELLPHPGGVRIRDLGSRNGTTLAGLRITDAVAPAGSIVVVGETELLLEPDLDAPEIPLSSGTRLGALIGRSATMRRIFTVIERVAPTDYTVLIEGDTGTGKEVVARTLHELSARRAGPFVVFDCSSTTESLIESELFGHVRGAFTGAIATRDGAFRRAHGGTLFIDELASLPHALQGKLLRALETRRIQPVGADREIDVDLRIVAASNRALADEVKAGRFRDDLLFRISVVRVALPPLRERREDIALLVEGFARTAGIEGEISGANLDRLVGHDWPGNVRELRNAIERAIALGGPARMRFRDLPISVGSDSPTLPWPIQLDLEFKEAKDQLVDAFERVYAAQLLDRCGGNISEAARRAGLSRRHFFELVKKHRLRTDSDES